MEAKTTESTTRLHIVRTYSATPNDVFKALTEPNLLSRWFAPTDEFETVVDRFDAEVDGEYRIEMRHKDGPVHTAIGTIREITPPSRLVYTWKWEGGEMPDTLVTWDLKDANGGTELTLTHDRLPNEEAKNKHAQGWNGILVRLEGVL